MTMKRVCKEAAIGVTILFTQSDETIDRVEHSFAMNHIDIISLDVSGDPVTPTTGSFDIFVRTDVDGGFKRITERSNFNAKLTGGSGLADGVAVDAKFVGFPLEFKIVPNAVDVAISYRVDIKQSSVQLGRTTPIETSEEGNIGVPVFIQDQTTPNIDLSFHRNLQNVTLAAPTVLDVHTATFEPGHGFVEDATPAHSLCILEGQNFSQLNVIGVVGDVVTFDSPFDKVYTTAATAIRHTFDMRFAGTPASPGTYIIKPIAGQKWDITRVILVIESANAMDFSKFGSINPLTNGCVLRKKDGDRQNYFNFKTNGEFINRSFDHTFQTKSGGGGFGFTSRHTWAGQGKQGVVVRLDGTLGEELQVLVQDALNVSLDAMFMIAQGHLVQE